MRPRGVVWIGSSAAVVLLVLVQGQSRPQISSTAVAVVDLPLIFDQARIVQDLERIFGQEKSRIQGEAEQRRETIQVLQRELDSGAFAKDSSDYENRLEKMERHKFELELFIRTEDRRLLKNHKKWFEEIYRRVIRACGDIARSGGVDIVLSGMEIDFDVPESGALVSQILQKKVVYASPRVDLTPQILARVDDEYAKSGGASQIRLAK